jgi:hypothetical protein
MYIHSSLASMTGKETPSQLCHCRMIEICDSLSEFKNRIKVTESFLFWLVRFDKGKKPRTKKSSCNCTVPFNDTEWILPVTNVRSVSKNSQMFWHPNQGTGKIPPIFTSTSGIQKGLQKRIITSHWNCLQTDKYM